jgi:hypothetical protein
MRTDPANHRLSLIVFACTASCAAWIDFGHFQTQHNADSLLPILVSLQRWTPFLWGQDRLGMLIPLLAVPIRSPLANLLTQNGATILCGLVAPFVLARYCVSDTRWVGVGAVANILLLSMSVPLLFDWFATTPYAVSTVLAVCSLASAERESGLASVVSLLLMQLACWENTAITILVFPLLVIRPSRRKLLVVVSGPALGLVLLHYFVTGSATPTNVSALRDWPAGWMALLSNLWRHLDFAIGAALTGAAGIASAWWSRDHSERRKEVTNAVVIASAGLVYMLIVGTLNHVKTNEYYPRYSLPFASVVAVAVSIALLASFRLRQSAVLTCLLAMLIAVDLRYGFPELHIRKLLNREYGVMTPDVINTKATAISGDYWTVWPAVFHANMYLYERGRHEMVFGLAQRSEMTRSLWLLNGTTSLIIAKHSERSAAEGYLAGLGQPTELVERRGAYDLFKISLR